MAEPITGVQGQSSDPCGVTGATTRLVCSWGSQRHDQHFRPHLLTDLKMRLSLPLLLVVTACSGLVLDKSIKDNSLPPAPAPSPQYGPPPSSPPQPGGVSLQYGPPPSRPTFTYGPPPLPPPPPKSSFALKPKPYSYTEALSLFEGECGYWKSLSFFLGAGVAITGLAMLFRLWPLPLDLLNGEGGTSAASRLQDPAFLSSVYDQVADISRVLMNIKDANTYPKEE